MLNGILPDQIFLPIKNKVGFSSINEIRLRANKPIILSIMGQKFFLSENGRTRSLNEAIIASFSMIEEIIFRASECSIYSVNEQIKKGFIVTPNGVRLGLAGNVIVVNGHLSNAKRFILVTPSSIVTDVKLVQ